MRLNRRQLLRFIPAAPAIISGGWTHGVGGGLPSGATAIWDYANYSTTDSNPIVRNSASAVTTFSKQIARQTTRIDGIRNYSTYAGTATFDSAFITGSGGLPTGAKITIDPAGGPWIKAQLIQSWPGAGDYTIKCEVKAISGAGEVKLVKAFGTPAYSSTLPLTSSWVDYEFNVTADQPFFGWGFDTAPSGPTVFGVDNFRVFPASAVDKGLEPLAGHLRLILSDTIAANVTYSGHTLSCLETNAGYIQFPTAHVMNENTFFTCGKILSPQHDDLQAWLSNPQNDQFMMGTNMASDGVGMNYGNGASSSALLPIVGWPHSFDASARHVFGVRGSTAGCDFWIDGVQVLSGVPTGSPPTPTQYDFLDNCLVSHPASMAYRWKGWWERLLSNGEMVAASAYLGALDA